MATPNQVREALLKTISDYWTVPETLFFDNEIQDKPYATTWLHFRVRNTNSSQTSLGKPGNRRYTHFGHVFAELWGPKNEGMKDLENTADAIRDLFQGIGTFNGVRIRTNDVSIRDGIVDGSAHSIVIEFEYEFDEIK